MRCRIDPTSYANLDNYIINTFHEKLKVDEFKLYPYGKIKADMKCQDDIYQCAFNYIHFHIAEDSQQKGLIETTESHEKSNIPLSLDVSRWVNQFTLSLKGDSYYINAGTARSILKYVEYYLDQWLKCNKATMLMPYEHQKLVYDYNQTEVSYIKDKAIYHLFEKQVKETPDNVALVFKGMELSYVELNKKANQLARYIEKRYQILTGNKVKPNTLIALCLDRSIEMIVSILAVLKSRWRLCSD